MTPDYEWVVREKWAIRGKLEQLTPQEMTAHLVPGSRSIAELIAHMDDPYGDHDLLHKAFHLGEINVLYKLALAKRASLRPVVGGRR